ncbi:alpha/beta fold hydrolase [Duganella sp. FT50W]|uniref:Alpha/beta fold hydrolase n=1 Tax=Duganella lactea TaxID=2692173 RepID=A0A6L8MCU2_9BURK|nr:alpha/beta hydrolase [Duganella lactea]MYM80460.1 alpha/beta fold hydrolase [Duganella lactea]
MTVAAVCAAVSIVLVHGAFADGASWSPVIAALQDRGCHVAAVQNPLTSLADDVAATRAVVERQPGKVLLVGHSWGGAVVTEAGNLPQVRGLVYLSALVPDSGESVAGLLDRLGAPMTGLAPDADGRIWLDDPAAYQKVMAADVPAATVALLAATQQPIAASAFRDTISRAAWHDKPSWYLMTENDQALPFAVQRKLAVQIKAGTVVLKSSHMSLQSQPRRVADFILHAAESL